MAASKRNVILITLAFFVLLDSLVFYASYRNARAHIDPVSLTAPAPLFNWKDFNDKNHKLSDLSGRVVVVHFWATWCVPCREEFPKLLKAANQHPEITFVAVSGDTELDK